MPGRTRGIFSGTYDPAVPGRIRWGAAPELDLSGASAAGLSGRDGHLRVSSFAECNGRLYAAIGQQIYERIDGAEPHWRLVYANRYPGRSETGLRGLTAIASPSGQGQVLLAAGHSLVNVGYGRLEAGGWYLVRRAPGRYDLRQVAAPADKPLVATRSIRVSPFARGSDAVYFAGYDANKVPAHDTAWIFCSTIAATIGPAR